jgi:hypothetical protein
LDKLLKNNNILYNYTMTTSQNYIFNNSSSIGNDMCGITAREEQNTHMGSYTTTNFFLADCGMKKPIEFATRQPGIFYNSGPGVTGVAGCNVESDSNLKIGTIQTHPKCRISLFQRPFATVPYLGRGPPKPMVESRMLQGVTTQDLKSCKTVSEKTFIGHTLTPLIPSIAATVQNPANLVESVAHKGWIRGGLPSRDLSRDQEYLQHHK